MTVSASVQVRRLCTEVCDGPFGSSIASKHYVDHGVRVVRLGNIGDARWRDEDAAFISPGHASELIRKHGVLPGDVVVAGLGDAGNPVGRAALLPDVGPAVVKADCHRLRLDSSKADPRYVVYALSTQAAHHEAASAAEGATRQRLTLGKTLSLRVPARPMAEQQRIANFLDAEVAAVEGLVGAKSRIVQLLNDRIDSQIKALVGDSPLAGGSVVPVAPIKRQLEKVERWTTEGEMVTAFRNGQVTSRALRGREGFTDSWTDGSRVQVVRTGDLVVHGLDGFSGAIGDAEVDGVCSPINHVCTSASGDTAFLARMLRLLAIEGYLGNFATSTRERAVDFRNWDLFGSIPIPLVPAHEQIRIGDEIRALRPLTENVRRTQELAIERRRSLISAVVTGEMEVP